MRRCTFHIFIVFLVYAMHVGSAAGVNVHQHENVFDVLIVSYLSSSSISLAENGNNSILYDNWRVHIIGPPGSRYTVSLMNITVSGNITQEEAVISISLPQDAVHVNVRVEITSNNTTWYWERSFVVIHFAYSGGDTGTHSDLVSLPRGYVSKVRTKTAMAVFTSSLLSIPITFYVVKRYRLLKGSERVIP